MQLKRIRDVCVCVCMGVRWLFFLRPSACAAQWSQDCISGGLDGICFTSSHTVWWITHQTVNFTVKAKPCCAHYTMVFSELELFSAGFLGLLLKKKKRARRIPTFGSAAMADHVLDETDSWAQVKCS